MATVHSLSLTRFDCLVTTDKAVMKLCITEPKIDEDKKINKNKDKVFKKILQVSAKKYKDLKHGYSDDNENIYLYSELRGVTFVFNNMLFDAVHNQESAIYNLENVFRILNNADKKYEIENSKDADPEAYIELLFGEYKVVCEEEDEKKNIRLKREAKQLAKSKNRFRYKIGEKYAVRAKDLNGEYTITDIYEVKKYIYTIGNSIVNTLVMKQLYSSGNEVITKQPINQYDCRAFHIKYEPNLYIFSMMSRLYKLSEEEYAQFFADKVLPIKSEIKFKDDNKTLEYTNIYKDGKTNSMTISVDSLVGTTIKSSCEDDSEIIMRNDVGISKPSDELLIYPPIT